MIDIYIDADACPVKDEIYQVASRHGLYVFVVANARMRVPQDGPVEMVVVSDGFDAADDWIAEQVRRNDVVVTSDIPLAARCLDAGALVVGSNGRCFEAASIGAALSSRELNQNLREAGDITGGPPPMSGRARSRFLAELDRLVVAGLRAERGA
jgi:uncharacterized protein YaiI (UPF0178 family)